MKTSFNSRNYDDFNQRYVKTYGWLLSKNSNKKIFVYLDRIKENFLYFNTGGGQDYHVRLDTDHEFEFIPVNKGWFNGRDGNPYFLYRVPARQWKRGIGENNTHIWNPYIGTETVSYNNLSNIYNDNFEAINYRKEFPIIGQNAAISKHFAVFDNTLYFFQHPIGRLQGSKITVTTMLVKQEISDLIKRNNWGVSIEHS